jgi:prolyl oligopeptidase
VPYSYPATRQDDVVDDYHGTPVADPYRWLEDTEAPDTRAWWAAQNELVEQFVATVPARDQIRQQLTELWDFPKQTAPFRHGDHWFQFRNTGLQDQPVLFVGDAPASGDRVLLDPNALAADGTVALTGMSFKKDGSVLAYGTSEGGSDWVTWRFRDVASGEDLPDVVRWTKFTLGAWTEDGFVYNGLDEPTEGQELLAESLDIKVHVHTLGTEQSADQVLWRPPADSGLIPQARVTDDGAYITVTATKGSSRETRVEVLSLETGTWTAISPDNVSSDAVVGNEGSDFLLFTDRDAERGRVVRVALAEPDKWAEVVPADDDALLGVFHVGGRLLCHYLHHAQSQVRVFGTDGARRGQLPIPPVTSLLELHGKVGDSLLHYATTSFTDPGSIYSYDLDSGEQQLVWRASVALEDVVAEQAFLTSEDGEVTFPVFLVHKKDVVPNGEVPVLLYAYGGFGIPTTPTFSVPRAVWIERGGLLAIPNIRGGGEYGKDWHNAARVKTKPKTFDDFCTTAAWLGGASGWSRPGRIAINGGSNGGLLVGACLVRRPELFGAAVPEVGVLDIVRFPKFTIGWAWKSDYDDPDTPDGFANIIQWSPLHNVREADYPPVLVMTGDRDDRVVPGHSFKFAAALQAAQRGEAPVLIRVETSAGHGMGKPTSKMIAERTDFFAFLEHALRLDR